MYVVRPERPVGAGVVYLHWFDEAPNANRSQFLEEAKALAGAGAVSVLPQLAFPWKTPPTDIESDLSQIQAEARRVREAYDVLRAAGADRIGVVGHDFGAMHGMLLLGEVSVDCAVLVAATPRWSDWFLPFWQISTDRYEYMRQLEPVDPIAAVTRADMPLLFQFGNADFYIAAMTALELFRAAPEPKQMASYDSGHAMDGDDIQSDRVSFLASNLDFEPIAKP